MLVSVSWNDENTSRCFVIGCINDDGCVCNEVLWKQWSIKYASWYNIKTFDAARIWPMVEVGWSCLLVFGAIGGAETKSAVVWGDGGGKDGATKVLGETQMKSTWFAREAGMSMQVEVEYWCPDEKTCFKMPRKAKGTYFKVFFYDPNTAILKNIFLIRTDFQNIKIMVREMCGTEFVPPLSFTSPVLSLFPPLYFVFSLFVLLATARAQPR